MDRGRLDAVTVAVNESLSLFELGEAQQMLYDFVWNDFCDWYIEMAKVRFATDPRQMRPREPWPMCWNGR